MKYNVKRHAVVQPLDQSIKLIALTKGKNTVVDASQYAELAQWNWCVTKSPNSKTYYAIRTETISDGTKKTVWMHRVILGLADNDDYEVDHRNHDGLDNRRINLRVSTHSENLRNTDKHQNNKSGYKGVCWSKKDKQWRAQATHLGKHVNLGGFRTKESALAAYRKFVEQHHGEFAHF